ncbi:hypothetical protein Q7P37_008133 [Cladosporium fusiforme]
MTGRRLQLRRVFLVSIFIHQLVRPANPFAMAFQPSFDPTMVNINEVSERDLYCYLQLRDNAYSGGLGGRISALFVIGFVAMAGTAFPVMANRVHWLRIPTYVYLFARYFGTGIIVSTAYIHLLDPAYKRIGKYTCVGMTGDWADYNWTPAIVLASTIGVWLIDVCSSEYVRRKYGVTHDDNIEHCITAQQSQGSEPTDRDHLHEHTMHKEAGTSGTDTIEDESRPEAIIAFKQQFSAFLIMEFSIILHSVFIGLNFGVVDDEWKTLYPVLVFHQLFEGLGIGARMSAIPFPRNLRGWLPWVLCAAYALSTPIAIAAGLGVRTTWSAKSLTSLIVIGVANAISAGILIYTGLVELLARDFIFDENRTKDGKRLTFMTFCVLLGAGIMSLVGKWA